MQEPKRDSNGIRLRLSDGRQANTNTHSLPHTNDPLMNLVHSVPKLCFLSISTQSVHFGSKNWVAHYITHYDTIWYSRIWHHITRYSSFTTRYDRICATWCDTIRYDMIGHNTIEYDMIRYSRIRHDTIWHDTVWCGTTRFYCPRGRDRRKKWKEKQIKWLNQQNNRLGLQVLHTFPTQTQSHKKQKAPVRTHMTWKKTHMAHKY